MKKVYVNAQWQGGADRSTYDGAEELRKYLPVQDYVILPVSTEEAEMAVMRNGIRDLMFYKRDWNDCILGSGYPF